ncbi:acyl-CoA thioesterase [Candidatus Gracilibacteria bacterium]|nr:acyl-CoA thioesterase [Candidatus Gracilibacteria bacterium]
MAATIIERVADEERMADLVLPHQTNGYGTMFGGDVMAMMDKAAAIAALRFCRQPVVTASSERIDFRTPIRQGEIIEAHSKVVLSDAARWWCACVFTPSIRCRRPPCLHYWLF